MKNMNFNMLMDHIIKIYELYCLKNEDKIIALSQMEYTLFIAYIGGLINKDERIILTNEINILSNSLRSL